MSASVPSHSAVVSSTRVLRALHACGARPAAGPDDPDRPRAGCGVALVVVNALSSGLDRAQDEVLRPLTGVGTDLSVTRPIQISNDSGSGFPQLSDEERAQLERE